MATIRLKQKFKMSFKVSKFTMIMDTSGIEKLKCNIQMRMQYIACETGS
jgi:hypothetical protein